MRPLHWAGAVLLTTAAACSGDSGLGPGETADLRGEWLFSEQIAERSQQLACSRSGPLLLSQQGEDLTGSGHQSSTCTSPATGEFHFESALDLTAGRVSGTAVSFTLDDCPYTGAVYGSHSDTVRGRIDCHITTTSDTLHITGTWRMVPGDSLPPSAAGATHGAVNDTILRPGDPLRVTVHGKDDQSLAWIGYQLGPPANVRDSAAASGNTADAAFDRFVTVQWSGTVAVTVFARDAWGHLTETALRPLRIGDFPTRPTRTLTLSGRLLDLAYDASRGRLYLSDGQAMQISVVELAPFGQSAPIMLPGRPGGLDLSTGADSLLIALRDSVYMAVADLVRGTVDTVRLPVPSGGPPQWPDRLRVMGNGKVLVSLTFDGSGFNGALAEYDLTDGSALLRSDAGKAGQLTESTLLTRTQDREHLLLLIDGSCCPVEAQLYTGVSDGLSAPLPTVSRSAASVSTDATGAHWLIGQTVFDAGLSAVRSFTPSAYTFGPTALAPNGSTIYLGIEGGFLIVDTTDGTVREEVRLGVTPERLVALPDGATVVAAAGPNVLLVDLR